MLSVGLWPAIDDDECGGHILSYIRLETFENTESVVAMTTKPRASVGPSPLYIQSCPWAAFICFTTAYQRVSARALPGGAACVTDLIVSNGYGTNQPGRPGEGGTSGCVTTQSSRCKGSGFSIP